MPVGTPPLSQVPIMASLLQDGGNEKGEKDSWSMLYAGEMKSKADSVIFLDATL